MRNAETIGARLFGAERGMTIVETTVMLSVAFILAGVLSPVVSTAVGTARSVKAANDSNMLAAAVINLQRDTGAVAGPGLGQLPDVIVTEGESPVSAEDAGPEVDAANAANATPDIDEMQAQAAAASARASQAGARARAGRTTWRRAWNKVGRFEDYFVANRAGFPLATPGRPGWNGPYLSRTLDADPWGNLYATNTGWLDGGSQTVDARGRIRRAVFVLSAGPNGRIDSPFEQPMTDAAAYGDDVAVRIQ